MNWITKTTKRLKRPSGSDIEKSLTIRLRRKILPWLQRVAPECNQWKTRYFCVMTTVICSKKKWLCKSTNDSISRKKVSGALKCSKNGTKKCVRLKRNSTWRWNCRGKNFDGNKSWKGNIWIWTPSESANTTNLTTNKQAKLLQWLHLFPHSTSKCSKHSQSAIVMFHQFPLKWASKALWFQWRFKKRWTLLLKRCRSLPRESRVTLEGQNRQVKQVSRKC